MKTAEEARKEALDVNNQVNQKQIKEIESKIQAAILKGDISCSVDYMTEVVQGFLRKHGYKVESIQYQRESYYKISW